jgi:Tol biopolymer transport system component
VPLPDSGGKLSIASKIYLINLENQKETTLPVAPGTWSGSRIAVSPRGKIYYCNVNDELRKFDLKSRIDLPALVCNSYTINPSCSHDGRYVLFEANLTGATGYRDIYCLDENNYTANIPKLTNSLAFCGSPCFTFDDRHIIYDCRDASGLFDLWIMNSDGTNPDRLALGNGNNCQRPACSPVNNWLAYQKNIQGVIGIYASLIKNNKVIKTVTVVNDGAENINPSWTTDGKAILFQKKKTVISLGRAWDDYDVYIIKFDQNIPQQPVAITSRALFNEGDPCSLPILDDSTLTAMKALFPNSAALPLPRNSLN